MSEKAEFERMMRQNGPRIYSLAIRLTGQEADGHDLAQETFMKAYASWEKFRGDSEVSSWLYRICVNLWKNRVRYEKRRSFWKHFSLGFSKDGDDEAFLDLPSGEPGVDQGLETQEKQSLVQGALAVLSPEDREIVVLRDMEDQSYEEIAALLELPIGTVKSRLARAREKLRIILMEKGVHHE